VADLTPKQERFAQLYVELGSAAEAYRRAYSSGAKPETCQRSGHDALHHPKISARIEEIRDQIAERALWKRLKSVEVLSSVALEGEKDSDRVAAVKALNAMYGWDKQTIDHTSSDRSMSPRSFSEMYGTADDGES